MNMTTEYMVMVYEPSKGRPIFIDRDLKQAFTAKAGITIRTPHTQPDMITPSYFSSSKTVPVNPLSATMVIPTPVVASWKGGSPEEFVASLGWRYSETTPSELSVAHLIDVKEVGMSSYTIVMGGQAKTMSFPFSSLLGLEGRSSGSASSLISVTLDPAEIHFPPNSCVTCWGPITDVFRGSMSHAGIDHDWKTGPGVYVRYLT